MFLTELLIVQFYNCQMKKNKDFPFFFFNMKAKARYVILRQKGEIMLIFEPHKK